MGFLRAILGWLSSGPLDRVFDTVDQQIAAQTDRDRVAADVVQTYMKTRASWMEAGGFWLTLLFALPVWVHFGAVCLYSVLWCADCAFPQGWTIAALPPPMDAWERTIIMASIGVHGLGPFLSRWRR